MNDLESKSNNEILFEIKQMEADLFDFTRHLLIYGN
jgi:hypothetical protein